MLCKKCGKYPCYERKGRVFALCAFCSLDAIQEALESPDRAAELQRAPVQTEQKCPNCDGVGSGSTENGGWECCICNGTGISKRSVSG